MNEWVEFYERRDGLHEPAHASTTRTSRTEYSSLMSKVMANGNDRIKFPINEPAAGQEEVADRRVPRVLPGPGRAAHRARHRRHHQRPSPRCATAASSSSTCRRPTTTSCRSASARSTSRSTPLAELGILVDRDPDGYLLQIFTKPVEDRPTLFYEIIQRKGAKSFGKGNFKALFEAIEREQALRGNL